MKSKLSLSENAIRNRALAGAILMGMGVVTSAHAQTSTLYGGGATLPAVGYVGGAAALGGTTDSRLATASGNNGTTQDDSASLFGAVYLNDFGGATDISYCQTGSGAGKAVLEGVDPANNNCPTFSVGATGFGAPSGGPAYPNFAASDSPLSQSDVNNFSWSASHTALVQFPALAGAIAIVYNPTNTGFSTSTSSHLALTDSQICQIFSGQITNWNQITGNGALNSLAITVAYRSDGSGTSFNFSNHLAAVCGADLPSGDYFSTNQSFASAAATAGYTVVPADGKSGNPGVVAFVNSTPGAIGYAELANALAQSPSLTYATVNGFNPSTAFSSPFPSSTTTLSYVTGKVISGVNTSTAPFGNPTLATVSGDSQSSCLLLVDPNSFANLSGTYPIVAVTYLLGYYSGNGTNTASLQTLLSAPYDTVTAQPNATDIGSGTGLAWLNASLSSNVSNCINN